MGGLAPGKLKSRRGLHSSPRRLLHRFSVLTRDSRTQAGKLYQLCGSGDIFIATDSRPLGPLWSARMAHSFTAADRCGHGRFKTSAEEGNLRLENPNLPQNVDRFHGNSKSQRKKSKLRLKTQDFLWKIRILRSGFKTSVEN